jgi:hypothetical protein
VGGGPRPPPRSARVGGALARVGGGPPARGRRRVSCACGQEYVVVGTDRHRVYWLAGAGARDPVLGQRCSVCQTPLPAEQEAARMT